MPYRLLPRAVSFFGAALVTLAMLGGIDSLSRHEAAAPLWAQAQTQVAGQPS